MALKSSYNGEEQKMRMSRIAKPRSNAVTGATTSGLMKKVATAKNTATNAKNAVLRQKKGPLASAAKQKTATPRSAVLRQAKSAPSSGSGTIKKSGSAGANRKKIY